MRRKGVCYDVGRELEGRSWRPDFRLGEVRRELEIIARDLHCTAVRIQGADVSRLGPAALAALSWDSRCGCRRSCGTATPRTRSPTS